MEKIFEIDLLGDPTGYTGEPCPNCKRFRVINYSGGKQICEKCKWSPQANAFIDIDELLDEKMRYEYDKSWEDALRGVFTTSEERKKDNG